MMNDKRKKERVAEVMSEIVAASLEFQKATGPKIYSELEMAKAKLDAQRRGYADALLGGGNNTAINAYRIAALQSGLCPANAWEFDKIRSWCDQLAIEMMIKKDTE